MEGLKCHFLMIVLMRNKDLLHNINVDGNMVGLYKTFIHLVV
jgi:hypothetical protein